MLKFYKRTKSFSCVMLILVFVLSMTSCAQSNQFKIDADNIYNFENYKSDDVYNIERVELTGSDASKCASYRFTYLSDGYEIKGYISLPLTAIESQKPCKVLLYNRGGNNNLGALDDDSTATICAEVGDRIVIASQYRGAGGSGGKDQFGGDDVNDVIKLIDLCEKEFKFADMDDFCVAGVSRGGMMTYMSARRDKRIKRIIAVSAVSDLFQSYNERDDMKEVLTRCIGGSPDVIPKEYEKRSAIYWTDDIKIPVLIIHSKQDEKVSYSQAEAMNAKLSGKTECKFISHDDDVHGIHKQDFEPINEWLGNG